MGGVPVPGVTGCGLGYTLVHHRVKSDCSVSVDRVSSLVVCITSSGRQEAHMTSKDKGQRPDVAAGSSESDGWTAGQQRNVLETKVFTVFSVEKCGGY